MNKEGAPVSACPPSIHTGEYLRRKEQKKEPEPIPIDREEFMFNLEATLDTLKDEWMKVQLQIVELENIKAKVIKYEDMGLRTKFYMLGNQLMFQAYRRKPMGFQNNQEANYEPRTD